MGQAAASSPSVAGLAGLEARIEAHFADSAKLKQESAKLLSGPIARAVGLMAASLKSGGKILACGNGGSAADPQHFPAPPVHRLQRRRPPPASIALTTANTSLHPLVQHYRY